MEYETDRLVIRFPRVSDAKEIFECYTQDSEVTKYLIWTPHKHLGDSINWVEYCLNSCNTDTNLKYVIEFKGTKKAIGMIDFRINGMTAEFGYVLGKNYWNQGLMTEAMIPVFNTVFSNPNIFRIQACHDIDNHSSGKVMKKLGMVYEGILRKYSLHPNISIIPRDVKMYSKVKE